MYRQRQKLEPRTTWNRPGTGRGTDCPLESGQEALSCRKLDFLLVASRTARKAVSVFIYLFVVMGINPRASCMLGKGSATELHPQLFFFFLKF